MESFKAFWWRKERIALERVIVSHPYLVLADEPTGNLNCSIARKIVL